MKNIEIHELNLDRIQPNFDNMNNPEQGGSKIVIIGKPGTGKTTLITRILYEKRHIFPSSFVMSGTEDSNGHYGKIMPSIFVHNKYDERKVEDFVTRQKISKKHLLNPWSVLLLDDCTDDPKIFNKPIFQGLFKNGRHWKMLFILRFSTVWTLNQSFVPILMEYSYFVRRIFATDGPCMKIMLELFLIFKRSVTLWINLQTTIPRYTSTMQRLPIASKTFYSISGQSLFLKPSSLVQKTFGSFTITVFNPVYSDPF